MLAGKEPNLFVQHKIFFADGAFFARVWKS